MHELAIIHDLVNNVLVQSKCNGISKVTKIKLSVGKMSGVFTHALEFGFNAIKIDTELEGAQLVITEIEPLLYCEDCRHQFVSEEWSFTCERCNSFNVRIIEGQELILDYFEGTTEGEENNG